MPRKKRIWYSGAIYHVMSRGNRKTDIYKEPRDYLDFLELMKIIQKEYPFLLHACCLMTNHFHFLLETSQTELSKIMQKLLGMYAEGYNRRYSFTGHLFQGRYTASLIENERYFLEVSRYIHLNPVKAMMVKRPADYQYSSLRCYLSDMPQEPDPAYSFLSQIITTSRVFSSFQDNPSDHYLQFVEERVKGPANIFTLGQFSLGASALIIHFSHT